MIFYLNYNPLLCDQMCGIFGCVSAEPVGEMVLTALGRIQYRGYDSAGIGLILPNGEIALRKQGLSNIGRKVDDFLYEIRSEEDFSQLLQQANLGLGHTRWATHGPPSDINAHPHLVNGAGDNRAILLVHNGINNSHSQLVEHLGNSALSDTDSEQIGALINLLYDGHSLLDATIKALTSGYITGSNAIVVASPREPNKIVAAQIEDRPLYIGVSESASYICSDIPTLSLLGIRKQVPLNAGEVAILTADGYEIYDLNGNRVLREPDYNPMSIELAAKGGYEHFMLAEIASQGNALKDAQVLHHDAIKEVMGRFADSIMTGNKLYLLGNGTSLHAAIFGANLFRNLGISSESVAGKDLIRYPVNRDDTILAFSQSGETADIITSSSYGKKKGAKIYSLVNVIGSSLTRIASNGEVSNNIYLNCGPEICVVATKSFLSQLYRLIEIYEIIAMKTGQIDKIVPGMKEELPQMVQETVDMYLDGDRLNDLIDFLKESRAVVYTGLGNSHPISLEGALKLNETAYVPSLGILASQLKHGPIALFDPMNPKSIPLVAVVSYDDEDTYRTMESNIREVQARNGIVVSVVRDNKDDVIRKISNYTIPIPDIPPPYCYLPVVVPLQLLAYRVALQRDCDIDQPRNLAKSVTVE